MKKESAESDTIKFTKFDFLDPTTNYDPVYPIDKASAQYLRTESNSISVMLESEDCDINLDEVKASLKSQKLYPPVKQSEKDFWLQMKEVIHVQALVKEKRGNPDIADPLYKVMPARSIPELWKDFSILEVSESGHDEFPGDWCRRTKSRSTNDNTK